MKRYLTFAAAGIALAAAHAPAHAQLETAQTTVTYNDLDLTTTKGQRALQQRLEKAARKLCEVDGQRTGSRTVPAEVRACHRQAKASSQRQFAAVMDEHQTGG